MSEKNPDFIGLAHSCTRTEKEKAAMPQWLERVSCNYPTIG